MDPGAFGLENLLKLWSSSSQFLAAPQGPHCLAEVLWAPGLSISDSCLGKLETDIPVLFFSLQQVPTPEGKQHTEGQQGQSSVWTQPLPTDRACQSLDLACLECREELSHRGTWAWHHVKLWGRDCHRERAASCKTCALIRRPLFRRACVLEAPPAKGQWRLCGS